MTNRLLRLSGVAVVGLVAVSLLLGGSTPGSDASASELASFYDGGWRQGVAAFALAATVPFLVLFAAALTGAAANGAGWGNVLMAGAVLAGAGIAVTAAVHFALADAGDQVSPLALQAVNALDNNTWLAFNTGFGVMMLGAAGCLWHESGARLVLGRFALALGVLLFLPFVDFIALLATLVWMVVASIALYRSERGPRTVAVTAT